MIKPVQLVSDEMLKDVSLFVSPRFQCSCWDLLWPAIIITVKIGVISVFTLMQWLSALERGWDNSLVFPSRTGGCKFVVDIFALKNDLNTC